MKNFFKLFGIIAIGAVIAILAGCSTVDRLSQDNRGKFQNIAVPDKDFTSLGLVFVEKSYEQDEKGTRGDIYTYYALLQEAKKLGGDYIINITIDVKTEGTFNTFFGKQRDLVKGKVIWYGAATAIKYGNSLKESTTITTTPSGSTTVTNERYSIDGGNGGDSSGGNGGGSSGGSGGIKGFFDNLFKKK